MEVIDKNLERADIRYNMIIIKGEIKTSKIMSCEYDENAEKWNIKFNNGKIYPVLIFKAFIKVVNLHI